MWNRSKGLESCEERATRQGMQALTVGGGKAWILAKQSREGASPADIFMLDIFMPLWDF